MSHLFKPVISCLGAACLAAPLGALAADNSAVACSVMVDYSKNDVLVERYLRDFVVAPDTPFVDDFGTRLRLKQFTATVTRASGTAVVSFDYFNDVGVFHAVAFNGGLSVRGGGDAQSTSGSHSFFAANGTTGPVGGKHLTSYTVSCRKA